MEGGIEGILALHPNSNLNPDVDVHHPVLLMYNSAREHCHALIVAALKIGDCCHKEKPLLNNKKCQMSSRADSTDYHAAVLAAVVALGNGTISGCPISATIAACHIDDNEVARF